MTMKDGGPAFPVECCYNHEGKIVGLQTSSVGGWETGMTLRDYFAAKALAGICATLTKDRIGDLWEGTAGGMREARAAYVLADAMLAARTTADVSAAKVTGE